ncbi:hypothetical protein MTO96_008525 [Rhipicephalus appendiculatus]
MTAAGWQGAVDDGAGLGSVSRPVHQVEDVSQALKPAPSVWPVLSEEAAARRRSVPGGQRARRVGGSSRLNQQPTAVRIGQLWDGSSKSKIIAPPSLQ